MSEKAGRIPEFWEYLSGIMTPEASLWDWRTVLGKEVDFEAFRRKYLLSTDRLTMRIFCPLKCNSGCSFCNVSEPYGGDDAREGFCPETLKSFPVENKDIIINEFQGDVLFAEAAGLMGIEPKLLEIPGCDYAWELGCVPDFPKVPVYGTLLCMGYQTLELFASLNRKTKGPYILLVTHDDLINDSNKLLLDDCGASYVPLNKTVRFKADAKLELIGEFDLRGLIASPHAEVEPEPENIFRQCGDAWEIRFNGGEKFMLTTGNTGATYLHFMLARPNVATPVIEIVRSVSGESGDCVSADQLGDDDLSSGYSVSDLPGGQADFIADEAAIRQYRQEMQLIMKEITDAETASDNITAEQLRQDLKELTEAVNQTISPVGQKRYFSDGTRKLSNTFRRAVFFTIDKIACYDGILATHLLNSIRSGQIPGYFPESAIFWKL